MTSKFSRWVGSGFVSLFLLLGGWAGLKAQTPPPQSGELPLELAVDRGCGANYREGEPLTVIYRASQDAVATLKVRRDGTEQVVFANRPVRGGVLGFYRGTVGSPGRRLLILEAVAGERRGRAECAFQSKGNTGTPQSIVLVNGGGSFQDTRGRPIAGAVVQLTNAAPDFRSFRSVTNANGTFRFVGLPLTSVVRLTVVAGPFLSGVDLEYPRDLLREDGADFVLELTQVRVTGKVVLSEGGPEQGVPHALLFAQRGAEESPLGETDASGVFDLTVPLEEFGSPDRGTVRVELPDALTLGGHFTPGPHASVPAQIKNGLLDLGVVRFQQLSNADPVVRLAGLLYVRDSVEPTKFNEIDGLVLRAVDPGTNRVVAETVTRSGRWSLTLPRGWYAFEAPNATELGFSALPRTVRRIEFSRNDFQKGLARFVPQVLDLEPQRLIFSYPETRNLSIQEVVLRVNDEVEDLVSSVKRDGSRFTVVLARPLNAGDRLEVAVRINGLLTLFSPARSMGENR